MLKLTHSFCRYSRLTCENISYHTLVEHLTHISCSQKTCVTRNHQQSLLALSPTSLQLRLLANIRKRFRLKKSHANTAASNTHKQMSEYEHPTLSHYSHGGQFEISEYDLSDDQRLEYDDNESDGNVEVCANVRIWEPVGNKTDRDSEGFKFKVMSYNVLAQYLLECHPYLYTECVGRNLKWKVRAAKLYEEIMSLSPDILCLQEVQVSHLNSFYKKFEAMGYFGIFKQKTGLRHDGCAIYFKQSLFDMQDHISVEFYQPEMPILNRDNIGLMVKLAPKCQPGTSLVVATTHLLYNPKRTDVRLAQMQVMLAEIDRFAYIDDSKGSGYLPIILTGDFNSTPKSPVIELLDAGHVSAAQFRDNSDWRRIGVTDNCQHLCIYLNRPKGIPSDFSMLKIFNSDYTVRLPDHDPNSQEHNALFNGDDLSHGLKIKSVYKNDDENAEPEVTTFQDYWVTVDYIYFSCHKSLRVLERLKLPKETECEDLGMLPNERYGSDHLSLAATFELQPL